MIELLAREYSRDFAMHPEIREGRVNTRPADEPAVQR